MKFFVSAMIEKDEVLNTKTMQFEKVEKYLHNPCGSDYGIFVSDLKTLEGLTKRMKNWKYRKDVKEVHIFSCGNNQFDEKSYRLLKVITEFDKMSF